MPQATFRTIAGGLASVPNGEARLVHVQFRRFAGCPVCNFHLMTLARRHSELIASGVHELVFFHSTPEEMQKYQSQLPFDCVADPSMRYYKAWGVERSIRSLLHPRVLISGGRWVLASRRLYKKAENGILGLPADFLIDASGMVVAAKYGAHADDQWSVDEVLALSA